MGSDICCASSATRRTRSGVRSDLFIEPVMHSSVKSAKTAPWARAFRAHASTLARLASGSAILLCMATAATFTVSSVILVLPKSVP